MAFSKRKIDSQTSQAVLQHVLTEDFKFSPKKDVLISSCNAASAQ